jgi:hypothetical protein
MHLNTNIFYVLNTEASSQISKGNYWGFRTRNEDLNLHAVWKKVPIPAWSRIFIPS